MQDMLHPFVDALQANPNDISLVDEGAIIWKCVYYVLNQFIERNPNWIVRRHEDLSLDSVQEFRSLYNQLDIPFNNRIANRIRSQTQADNPVDVPSDQIHQLERDSRKLVDRWKVKLTPEEIDRIRSLTMDVSNIWYSDDDW